MTLRIDLPLTEQQVQACASAAQALGVETWELAVHALAHHAGWFDPRRNFGRPADESPGGGSA